MESMETAHNSSSLQPHLLQSPTWGELKGRFGWTPYRIEANGAAAQLLFRRLPLGLTIAYVPKGPQVNWTSPPACQRLFAAVHIEAQRRRAIFLKVEPHLWELAPEGTGQPAEAGTAKTWLRQAGFNPGDTIQPRTSLLVDIAGDEAAILAAMKQKTRYNIRLAEKRGVTVRTGAVADVATFYRLALTTAARDGFGIHKLAYYQAAYNLFAPDRCALLLAEFEGQALAALMVFCAGPTAYYFFGASANEYRDLMPTYLIQWAAMCWAKSRGCAWYDLWGIPDADPATLEANFQQRDDGLWGVYRFKRGFGGQVARSIGAYDYVYKPLLYSLYRLRRSR